VRSVYTKARSLTSAMQKYWEKFVDIPDLRLGPQVKNHCARWRRYTMALGCGGGAVVECPTKDRKVPGSIPGGECMFVNIYHY